MSFKLCENDEVTYRLRQHVFQNMQLETYFHFTAL